MTNQTYPPLRPQRPVRAAARRPAWPTIVAVALLAVLAGVVIAILVSGGDDDGVAASPSSSATASASTAGSESASPSSSPSASAAASQSPGDTPVPLAADTIVVTTVDGLSVRAEPGTGAERLGSLSEAAESFVVAGPTNADGYAWYLLSALGLPPNTGCAGPPEEDPFNCPIWFGWVAGTSEDGEPWLTPVTPDCPTQPYTAEGLFLARTPLQRLACIGSEPFTFRAWLPEVPPDAMAGEECPPADRPSGWLLCQNTNPNYVTIDDTQGWGGIGGRVSIDPASGVTMPPPGTWIELRVHLDDPAAQQCREDSMPADPRVAEQAVVTCRSQMVVESVVPVEGP